MIETPAKQRKRLLRKAKARWRRKQQHEEEAEELLLLRVEANHIRLPDGRVLAMGRLARNAQRGLWRRGIESGG